MYAMQDESTVGGMAFAFHDEMVDFGQYALPNFGDEVAALELSPPLLGNDSPISELSFQALTRSTSMSASAVGSNSAEVESSTLCHSQ